MPTTITDNEQSEKLYLNIKTEKKNKVIHYYLYENSYCNMLLLFLFESNVLM